jgi:hypothetical protein
MTELPQSPIAGNERSSGIVSFGSSRYGKNAQTTRPSEPVPRGRQGKMRPSSIRSFQAFVRKINSANAVTASASSFRTSASPTAIRLVVTLAMLASAEAASAGGGVSAYGTRDQVRQCAAEQEELDARILQRQRAHEAHVAALAKLEDESAEITRRQTTVNQDDETSVREFNQLVAAHNESVDKINQEALESRVIADSYNAQAISHNKRCAGLLIRPEDLAALRLEHAHTTPASAPSPAGASGALLAR